MIFYFNQRNKYDYVQRIFFKFSSLASKQIDNRWIRTGSEPFGKKAVCIVSCNRKLSTNNKIKIIKSIPVLLTLALLSQKKLINLIYFIIRGKLLIFFTAQKHQ